MQRYILRRLLQLVPVLLLVTVATFALILLLPGDPAQAYLGETTVSETELEQVRHELGLDRAIPVQYGLWLWRILQGDFGRSIYSNEPVLSTIARRLPVTLQLGVAAYAIAVAIGLTAGVVSAVRRNSMADVGATVFSMLGVAIPNYWLGILLIFAFTLALRWLPASGFVSVFEDPMGALRHMALPAFALGTSAAAVNMRQTRSAVLEVLAQDYVVTARAKGLRERRVIWVHVLKNALLPVVTVMGLQISHLISGTVIVETMFAIPGMGRLTVFSIFQRDFLVVQGVVLMVALSVVLTNLVTDLLYAVLDPRIKYT
ncbi:MAG: ABC transporter permease [Chloroflexi bacterium]|nr:ABC transporter permease [Chloroflexota bacterium]